MRWSTHCHRRDSVIHVAPLAHAKLHARSQQTGQRGLPPPCCPSWVMLPFLHPPHVLRHVLPLYSLFATFFPSACFSPSELILAAMSSLRTEEGAQRMDDGVVGQAGCVRGRAVALTPPGWLWSARVCVCLCVCAGVCVCVRVRACV